MKKFIRFFVPLLLAVLLVSSIGWYLFVYDRPFTRDMLLKQARYHDSVGNAGISSFFYNLAYTQSGKDPNVAIELAKQYIDAGNYTKAEVTLTNAINSGATVELYTALSKVYVEQDKILDAIGLLTYVSNPALKEQLDSLRPTAPEPDFKPGLYSQYISVGLSSSASTIYSTVDGDYPSVTQDLYEEPLQMPAGETTVCAVAVDDSGLVSSMNFLTYTIGGVVEPAAFTDPAVEQSIRDIVNNHSSKPVYTNQLWDIKEYIVPEGTVVLDDLALLTHLESLTIQNKDFETLAPLSTLTKLKTLEITGCRFPVDDLAVLAALPELQNLTLGDCGLSTVASLSSAKKLTKLSLHDNTIRNLDPIAEIATLTDLDLSHNALKHLDVLSSLTELSKLDISYNSVSSLSPLAKCVKLTELLAANNAIESINGVSELPLLTYLTLDYNKLTDVDDLGSCTALTKLTISNNTITSIAGLSTLEKLETFDFSYNQVSALPKWTKNCALRLIDGNHNTLSSIDVLKKLPDITYVYMDYNLLTNVDALGDCYHLVQVNIYGNDISDVSALTEHNIIVNYNPT